jgi:hypothetical protein
MVPVSGRSCIGTLKEVLRSRGFGSIECLNAGESPVEGWDAIIVTAGVEAQLYFREDASDRQLEDVKASIMELPFVEECLTRQELMKRGTAGFFADMLVSPYPPGHFRFNENKFFRVQGGHDSLNSMAQNVFALLSGPDFKPGVVYEGMVRNIDFLPAICTLMDIPLPHGMGSLLTDIMA